MRLVRQVVDQAIGAYDKPEIINSDIGSQFICATWLEKMQQYGIKVSMDGKGRATDNAYIDRFWRTVKRDYIYLYPPIDDWKLEKGLDRFIKRYNFMRSHHGINRQKPVEFYKGCLKVAA